MHAMVTGALRSPLGRARALALLVALVAVGWLLCAAFEPLRLNWGDPWSDANVLTALEYSAKYGFWKTSFTDVLDIGPLTADSYRYTHYPPLAEITYGVLRKITGKADIGVYRVFAIGFSAGSLWFVHAYAKRVFGDLAAACAVMFFATSALFLQYADSVHQAPILGCTSFAALATAARFVQEKRRRDLWLTGALTFLSFLTAYDFYFFVPTAGLLTAWVLGRRLFERQTLQLAAAIAIGGAVAIVVKSLFIIGAIGWQEFKADFIFQFFERASTKYSVDYRVGLGKVVAARIFLFMTPLFFVLLPAHVVLALRRARAKANAERSASLAAPLILFLAGIPFLVVFSQLTATQVLAMQCLVPYYAIGFGVLVARLLEAPARWKKRAGMVLGAMLVAWQVVHVATFKKAFLRDDDRKVVATYLAEHDENDFVFTNLMSDGPIQYYFMRHLQPIDPNWPPGSYRHVLRRIRATTFHVVLFEDPNTRFVDKSLFPLLAGEARVVKEPQWTVIGAPPLHRAFALEQIAEFDRRVRLTFANAATLRLRAGDISVYAIGEDQLLANLLRSPWLEKPTTFIDFGKDDIADDFKFYGMRGHEPGTPYSWSIHRQRSRTVLTKTGVIWLPEAPVYEVGLLLNMPATGDYRVTLRALSQLPNQKLGAMLGDRVLMPLEPLGAAWEPRDLSFVVPKDALGPQAIVTMRFPYALGAKTTEAVAVDGEVPDVGVAFETLKIEPLP